MENNSIHPDEMERLLREAFLNTPDSEIDKVTDMMAQHVYSTNWNVTPPIDKAKHFAPKKLFFKGFSLNAWIGITTIIAIGTIAYFALPTNTKQTPNPSNSPQANMTPPVLKDTAKQEDILAVATNAAPAKVHKPHIVTNAVKTETFDTTKTKVSPPARTNGANTGIPKPAYKRYILVPDLSAKEVQDNEKRKLQMIGQLIKFDKKEWAYIPMGTTHINDKSVSLQAFYMQTHEVTNVQYRTFLYDLVINNRLREYERAAVYDSGWINVSGFDQFLQYFWNPMFNEYPVVNITVEGAQMYCDWLTIQTNHYNKEKGKPLMNDVRIPVVEEWMYAAKADNDSAVYSWGGPYYRNSRGNLLGNFYSTELNEHDGQDVTAPVLSYYPNNWGLYNMSGNVAEITRPYSDGMLYVKGGAWNLKSDYMKVNHDNKIKMDALPTKNVGFRPVVTFMAPQ